MMNRKHLTTILLVCVMSITSVELYEANDTVGERFYVAFPVLKSNGTQARMLLGLSTIEPKAIVSVYPGRTSPIQVQLRVYTSQDVVIDRWKQSDRRYPRGRAIHIESDKPISVYVMVIINGVNVAATYLPPVNVYTFSYYFVVKLNGRFYFLHWALVLAAHDETNIKFKKCSTWSYCRPNRYSVQSREYVAMKFYAPNVWNSEDVTISADKPILVITGKKDSMTVVLPIWTWSKQHVVVLPTQTTYSVYIFFPNTTARSVIDATSVSIDNRVVNYTIRSTGNPQIRQVDHQYIRGKQNFVLESTVPFAVKIVHRQIRDVQTYLIPPPLFPQQVFLRLPIGVIRKAMYIVLILAAKESNIFYYNDHIKKGLVWKYVGRGQHAFQSTKFHVSEPEVRLRHHHPLVHFGAYLGSRDPGTNTDTYTGLGMLTREMHRLAPRICLQTIPQPGDKLDNDCDGLFDEEALNEFDDDGDGKIDEDLLKEPVDGQWTSWQAWICEADCKEKGNFTRIRSCNNPYPANLGMDCEGDSEQKSYIPCFHDDECKAQVGGLHPNCPAKKWGVMCRLHCNSHCTGAYTCDRLSGRCEGCVEGYRGHFCNMTCPHECPDKCEREDGSCIPQLIYVVKSEGPTVFSFTALVITEVLIISLLILVTVIYCRKYCCVSREDYIFEEAVNEAGYLRQGMSRATLSRGSRATLRQGGSRATLRQGGSRATLRRGSRATLRRASRTTTVRKVSRMIGQSPKRGSRATVRTVNDTKRTSGRMKRPPTKPRT